MNYYNKSELIKQSLSNSSNHIFKDTTIHQEIICKLIESISCKINH